MGLGTMGRIGALALLVAVGAGVWWARRPPRAAGPLPEEAYVWQRAWTPAVAAAVDGPGRTFAGLVVLGAELTLTGSRHDVAWARVDWRQLAAVGRPVGVALRIGPFGGPFAAEDAHGRAVRAAARELVARAARADVALSELQIDFDCATADLAGYARWLAALRRDVAPLRVTLTALPDWLRSDDFGALAASADGYVLQVHSLAPPTGPAAPYALVDLALARASVERAAAWGARFRVALPTYGYVLAFGRDGRFLGLSAESSPPDWPDGVVTRTVEADPATVAALVRGWTEDRPADLEGIVWFRLPTDEDRLAWSGPTFAAVRRGERPRPALRVAVERTEPRVADVFVENAGAGDAPVSGAIAVALHGARVEAADGLGGFVWEPTGDGEGRFRCRRERPLRAGQRVAVGWLRLSEEGEVTTRAHFE